MIESLLLAKTVKHDPTWQQRLKALGLTQKEFARLTGWAENTVSRQMRQAWPMPKYVRAMIVALEKLTPEARRAWVAEMEAEAD